MSFEGDILFLDLARVTGWCEGPVRGPLRHGTVTLAPEGSSSAAIFAGCFTFIATRLQAFRPRVIAYEAPLDPRRLRATTKATIRQLNGLPAIVEAVAYKMGCYDLREAEVGDVRYYWLGARNIPSARGKAMVRDKLRGLGYAPQTLDASDAIAGHRFIAAAIDPALRSEPLTLLRERA
jgi:hypothetical protein